MKKRVYLLSASDRFNYGDLMFPIIAKYALNELGDFEFYNVATVKADLSSCCAWDTEPYKILLREDFQDQPTLIIAGGQVLGANWSKILSFITPTYNYIYKKFNGSYLEKLTQRMFGSSEISYPFIPSSSQLLSKFNIIYHAVGGQNAHNLPEKQEVARAFSNCAYFSARETNTQMAVADNFSIDVRLVPDSVLLISDMMPKKNLIRPHDREYVCAQFGYLKSKSHLDEVVRQLKQLYEETGLDITLLSIGNCPGHDDNLSIDYIKQHADFPVVALPCETIEQITCALAHSSLFVGTSLHGVIVSMSYGNPFVPVSKNIAKIEAYTNTWAPEYLKGAVNFNEIASSSVERLSKFVDFNDRIDEQKELVKASFDHISNIINNRNQG